MTLGRDEVQARKRLLFHKLLVWRSSCEELWTATAETPEAQRQVLDLFLEKNETPNKASKSVAGKWIDAGPHSAASVWETIRTGMQDHGRTTKHRKTPVNSFFKEGPDAIESGYLQKIDEAFRSNTSGATGYGSHSPVDVKTDLKQMTSLPDQEPQMARKRSISRCKGNDESQGGSARGLARELGELNANSFRGALVQEGPRKRFRRDRLGFEEDQSEYPRSRQPLGGSDQPAQRKEKVISETPTPSDDTSHQLNEEAKHTSTVVSPREARLDPNIAGASRDLPRTIVTARDVKTYLKDIDGALQNAIRIALESGKLTWTLPVKLHERPSSNLRALYQLCLGRNWHHPTTFVSSTEDVNMLHFLVSLIGAGLYSLILSKSEPALASYLSSYDSRIVIQRSQEQEKSSAYIDMRSDHLRPESRRHELAVLAARDESFRTLVLRPLARSKAAWIEMAAYEHLSAQASYSTLQESVALRDAICTAITGACETAMLLAAELDACGYYIQPSWFEPGTALNTRCMQPSIHHAGPPDPAEQSIALTLLPGVEVRNASNQWSVFAKATVHKCVPRRAK